MNVSIGKDLEEFVLSKVGSGDYASSSEVIREGLRILKERDMLFEARLEQERKLSVVKPPKMATPKKRRGRATISPLVIRHPGSPEVEKESSAPEPETLVLDPAEEPLSPAAIIEELRQQVRTRLEDDQ
ncbi:MAG: type II toxin-antitoxin system ParD family antitoxin [Candidatus Eisenbacteria bacterium]|uniref:Type II toxin-antitoxin system ParD family antitoxin n=1 Tax=Eiseniibacteriota bacterium TaxID=2212470 RepID=A0A7Y2EC93_UNCEI|nr:type II toxin-antitoxin system ParD family antitoxin [Candidatus Eisenbacteria bacterium]